MKLGTNSENEKFIELRRDEVAGRALQLWRAAGRPTNRDLEYWLQAELELVSERQRCGWNQAGAVDGS